MRATLASCLQQFSNIKTMRYIFSLHIHHSYTKAVHRSLNNHAIHILGKCIFQVIHTPLLLLYTTMIYLEKMEFSVFYFIPPSGRESSKKQFPDFLCRLMVSVQCCLSGYSSFCVLPHYNERFFQDHSTFQNRLMARYIDTPARKKLIFPIQNLCNKSEEWFFYCRFVSSKSK